MDSIMDMAAIHVNGYKKNMAEKVIIMVEIYVSH